MTIGVRWSAPDNFVELDEAGNIVAMQATFAAGQMTAEAASIRILTDDEAVAMGFRKDRWWRRAMRPGDQQL